MVVPVVTSTRSGSRSSVSRESALVSCTSADSVEPLSTIVDGSRPFTGRVGTESPRGLVGGDSPVLTRSLSDSRKVTEHLVAKAHVGVLIKRHSVGSRHKVVPASNTDKAIVHGKHGSIAFTGTSDFSNHSVDFIVERSDSTLTNCVRVGLVDETPKRNDGRVLGLNDELSQCSDNFKRSLSIGESHGASKPVDGTDSTRVVPSVLRTRKSVQVKVDSNSVFPSPSNGLEDVFPRDSLEVRLLGRSSDSPVTDR